jgi:hypothetical protein
MSKAKATVPVTERALLQRINRKLGKELESVRATRNIPLHDPSFGKYMRVDVNRNLIIDRDVDLSDLGRELKVLAPWESVIES